MFTHSNTHTQKKMYIYILSDIITIIVSSVFHLERNKDRNAYTRNNSFKWTSTLKHRVYFDKDCVCVCERGIIKIIILEIFKFVFRGNFYFCPHIYPTGLGCIEFRCTTNYGLELNIYWSSYLLVIAAIY